MSERVKLVHVGREQYNFAWDPASVTADLKISEIVDVPNWIVTAYCPLSIFG